MNIHCLILIIERFRLFICAFASCQMESSSFASAHLKTLLMLEKILFVWALGAGLFFLSSRFWIHKSLVSIRWAVVE